MEHVTRRAGRGSVVAVDLPSPNANNSDVSQSRSGAETNNKRSNSMRHLSFSGTGFPSAGDNSLLLPTASPQSSSSTLLNPASPSPSSPLRVRNGSVVFPNMALAQRSASLLRNPSIVRLTQLRRKSDQDIQMSEGNAPSCGSELQSRKNTATRLNSVVRRLSTANSFRCFDGAGSPTNPAMRKSGSLALFLMDAPARHTASLKTVATAVLMLVRMQIVVEKKRHAAAKLREAASHSESNSPSVSLPVTARANHATPRQHHAFHHATAPAAAVVVVTADQSKATVVTSPPAGGSTTPPPSMSLGTPPPGVISILGSGASHAPHMDNAEDDMSNTDDEDDDASNHDYDDISIASADSLDRIDDRAESSSSSDGEEDPHALPSRRIRTTFFPDPLDIAQLPELVQRHIQKKALKCLQRFVIVYRFKKYHHARMARRQPLKLDTLPQGLLDHSDMFRGWPRAMLEAAFEHSYTQTFYGGTFLAHPNEPQRYIYFLISGAATELRRANPSIKRFNPSRNAEVVGHHATPTIFKATAALVEEAMEYDIAIYAASSCTVALVPVVDVERAFRATAHADPSRVSLSIRYRHIREDRTSAFLQKLQAEATAAAQQQLQAASLAGVIMSGFSRPRGLSNVNTSMAPQSLLKLNLRSSHLLQGITLDQERLILSKLQPMSFFEGDDILPKDAEDFRNLYFILRGTVVAVSRYRDTEHDRRRSTRRSTTISPSHSHKASQHHSPATAWQDVVFSRWTAGQSVGDKAVYFQEPHVFTLRAEGNCDLVVLKRAALMNLLETSDRSSALKQCIASGALQVRANDPVVRLRLLSVRSIPCVDAALRSGVISDAFVRELHSLFRIKVFPANELITSTSKTVQEIIVIATGRAIVDPSGAFPFLLRRGVPVGASLLCNMRWRYPIAATTECEGWVLPVAAFVQLCRKHHLLKEMTALSAEQHRTMMCTTHADTTVFELETPQQVVDAALAHDGDLAAQQRLASRTHVPSHHLLEQKSFQLRLASDVPVPPLPSLETVCGGAAQAQKLLMPPLSLVPPYVALFGMSASHLASPDTHPSISTPSGEHRSSVQATARGTNSTRFVNGAPLLGKQTPSHSILSLGGASITKTPLSTRLSPRHPSSSHQPFATPRQSILVDSNQNSPAHHQHHQHFSPSSPPTHNDSTVHQHNNPHPSQLGGSVHLVAFPDVLLTVPSVKDSALTPRHTLNDSLVDVFTCTVDDLQLPRVVRRASASTLEDNQDDDHCEHTRSADAGGVVALGDASVDGGEFDVSAEVFQSLPRRRQLLFRYMGRVVAESAAESTHKYSTTSYASGNKKQPRRDYRSSDYYRTLSLKARDRQRQHQSRLGPDVGEQPIALLEERPPTAPLMSEHTRGPRPESSTLRAPSPMASLSGSWTTNRNVNMVGSKTWCTSSPVPIRSLRQSMSISQGVLQKTLNASRQHSPAGNRQYASPPPLVFHSRLGESS